MRSRTGLKIASAEPPVYRFHLCILDLQCCASPDSELTDDEELFLSGSGGLKGPPGRQLGLDYLLRPPRLFSAFIRRWEGHHCFLSLALNGKLL